MCMIMIKNDNDFYVNDDNDGDFNDNDDNIDDIDNNNNNNNNNNNLIYFLPLPKVFL